VTGMETTWYASPADSRKVFFKRQVTAILRRQPGICKKAQSAPQLKIRLTPYDGFAILSPTTVSCTAQVSEGHDA
jgi:hypothetical protein